jgi:RNA polymerase sigma-70 factor (ECF subfamily)
MVMKDFVNTKTTMTEPRANSEDTELANKLKRSEPDAILALYNAYFDRIYSLVLNQVARDGEAAQDIVQEVFLAATKSAHRFDGRSKVSTWLYSIAHKKVVDFYRHQKRDDKYKTKAQNAQSSGIKHSLRSEPINGIVGSEEEDNQVIQETLFQLPLHYRQALLLKYVEEMPVLDICRIMKRSPKSVEGLLTRARRELRDHLDQQNKG